MEVRTQVYQLEENWPLDHALPILTWPTLPRVQSRQGGQPGRFLTTYPKIPQKALSHIHQESDKTGQAFLLKVKASLMAGVSRRHARPACSPHGCKVRGVPEPEPPQRAHKRRVCSFYSSGFSMERIASFGSSDWTRGRRIPSQIIFILASIEDKWALALRRFPFLAAQNLIC